MSNSYRLPQHITPLEYHIRIEPIGPLYDKFKGKCIILFKQSSNLNYIILNEVNLNVSNVKLISFHNNNIIQHKLISTTYDKPVEQIKFEFDSLPQNIGGILIEYDGIINTDLSGFYKCTQKDKLIMVTQFEPVYARRLCPCFDEPHFKSIFKLQIIAENNKLVLSNTDIETVTNYNSTNMLYTFKPTPKMSIYLLAFYIGHADYIEGMTNNIRIRIYTPEDKSYSKLALKTTIKCLEFMIEYFNVPYPLDKLDLISVPKFSADAMENWGLIIFREQALICYPFIKANDVVNIIVTVCHELAHQWFGNLVTMEWWSELWLNESFATWMSYVAVHHIYPSLNINTQFFNDNYISALRADSIIGSHPIKVDVRDPSLITEIFDIISYSKGSSIIKMLVDYVGEDNFKDAVRLYMKKYKYGNTVTEYLWDCVSVITKKNIPKLMYDWINKKNYPLVMIDPYDKHHLQITQIPFTYQNNNYNDNNTDGLWIIPLSTNFLLKKKQIIFPQSQFTKNIDSNAFGFYLIFYHKDVLNRLLQNKLIKLNEFDIANMLSDLYFLLKTNHITYQYYLDYMDKLLSICKFSELLCNIVQNNYVDFKLIVKNDNLIKQQKNILIKYIEPVDFIIKGDDNISTILFKTSVLNFGCKLGIDKHINYCVELFNLFMNKNEMIINPNIVNTVFRIGLGKSNGFDFLMDLLYKNKKYEADILNCLGLVEDEDKYNRVLDLFKDDKIGEQNRLRIFSVAGSNVKLNHLLFPYIKNNWDLIYGKFKYIRMDRIIYSMKYLIGTPELVNDIKTFFAPKDKHGMEMAYNGMLELIQINYEFYNRINSNV